MDSVYLYIAAFVLIVFYFCTCKRERFELVDPKETLEYVSETDDKYIDSVRYNAVQFGTKI